MGKHKILLTIIVSLFGLGSLGSCDGGALSSLLASASVAQSESTHVSENSTGGSSAGGSSSSSAGSSSNGGSSSSAGSSSSSADTSTPPVVSEVDLTLPPVNHNAVIASDEEVVKVAAVGSKVTSISQVPAEEASIIRNFITKAFLTPEQVDLIVACGQDLFSGIGKATYAEASVSFAAFFPHLQAVLASVDGDQIGYFVQEITPLLQRDDDRSLIPNGLFFSLATSAEYQGALAAFSSAYPDFATQYNLYSSYFDGSVAYQESATVGTVGLTSAFSLIFGRALHYLLRLAIPLLSAEEKTLIAAKFAEVLTKDELPYSLEVKAALDAVKKNPVSIINHLGALLLSIHITKSSWTAICDHGMLLAKDILSIQKAVYFRSRSVNMSYVNSMLDLLDSKKDMINGEQLATLIKFAGHLLSHFTAADNEAIAKAQDEDAPQNPFTQLLATYDQSYALLTSAEKASFTALLSNLGLSYSELYAKVNEWKSYDFNSKADMKAISDYLASLKNGILTAFTPAVTKLKVDIYLQEPFVLRGTTINAKRFDIDVYSKGDSVNNYAISDIVAATGELGYHVGTFNLSDLVSGKSYQYAFGYDVVPTYLGMEPYQYPSFSSPSGLATFEDGILYLQEGTTLENLRSFNVSNFRFNEADGSTSYDVPINDSALTLVLSSTALGDGYLLLAYRASESLTIYGVMKTHIFAESTIAYVAESNDAVVILNGDNSFYLMKTTASVDGDGYVPLLEIYQTLSAVGIHPDAVGVHNYSGTYLSYHFTMTLRVIDPSLCTLSGIADFAPYLKTAYKVGDEFSLSGLKLYYTYADENGPTLSAGTLVVQRPQVSIVGFSTASPISSGHATVTYQGFSFSFYYSVTA